MVALRIHNQISEIPEQGWESLRNDDYPFLSYAYLHALEESRCVSDETGWHPLHLTIEDEDKNLLAAMPMYLKNHSWGEYVFDWSWQEAWENSGEEYFPKLVTAVPFTPATGPRILYCSQKLSYKQALELLFSAVRQLCSENNFSGWHGLFIEDQHLNDFTPLKLPLRMDCQYHWFNHNYSSFDDFLAKLTSRKRKSIRKERQKVGSQQIELRVIEGSELCDENVKQFYNFYELTYLKHGHYGHLNLTFFQTLRRTMAEQIMVIFAYHDEKVVAGSWFFKSKDTLYGRYWGCDTEFDRLHFETCYYQGIDYCIKHDLQCFNPGAQGEHKIQRGFEPISTWSVHWIESETFRSAVAHFVREEKQYMKQRITELAKYLPFSASKTDN